MEADCAAVQWLTVAAGLKYGSITVFGLLESAWTRKEIEAAVAKNVKKIKLNPALVCEVVDVDFLELSAEKVARRLRSCDYRPYLELGLALLLWRSGQAEIIAGVNVANAGDKNPGQIWTGLSDFW